MSAGVVAEVGRGGDGGDILALDSSPSQPQEHDHLSSRRPLAPHSEPPPGPDAGGEKKSASP